MLVDLVYAADHPIDAAQYIIQLRANSGCRAISGGAVGLLYDLESSLSALRKAKDLMVRVPGGAKLQFKDTATLQDTIKFIVPMNCKYHRLRLQ